MKGNKKGCRPAGVDRMELEFLDEDINRTLPGMIFDLKLTLHDLACYGFGYGYNEINRF